MLYNNNSRTTYYFCPIVCLPIGSLKLTRVNTIQLTLKPIVLALPYFLFSSKAVTPFFDKRKFPQKIGKGIILFNK